MHQSNRAGNLSISTCFVGIHFFAVENYKKSPKTLILVFKVVNVHTIKKHAIGACYGKQHVSAYLQPFSR